MSYTQQSKKIKAYWFHFLFFEFFKQEVSPLDNDNSRIVSKSGIVEIGHNTSWNH